MTADRPNLALTLQHSAPRQALASSKTVEKPAQMEPCARMVNAAAARIYAAWQPHVGHGAALREARAFAGRFHVLIHGPVAPLPDEAELDVTLAAVAAAMTILDAAAQ
ncbi:hypothetical protein ABIG04_006580 [Bradyrhizobium japonicum]